MFVAQCAFAPGSGAPVDTLGGAAVPAPVNAVVRKLFKDRWPQAFANYAGLDYGFIDARVAA